MKAASRLSRLLLVSPWPLLFFLVIPLLVILSVTLNFRVFLLGSTKPLLINNLCFAAVAGCRVLHYLGRLKKTIRYGSAGRRPRKSATFPLSLTEARASFAESGYHFDRAGNYGEKRDLGYVGITALYGGLFLLLAIGSWDNLRQFSGVVLDGMGPATDLNKTGSYRTITKGPLAAIPTSLPRMQIIKQYLPDSVYPMGATDVALYPEEGKARAFLLKPREPVSYGAYDIYMAKLVFEPQIVIKRRDNRQPVFNSIVTLNPLVQKRGVYSFYGLFQGYSLGGGVYYQPEKSNLMLVVTKGNEKVVSDMVFQADQEVTHGDFIISCEKMGQWSEIHVVHRRHKGLLVLGGIVALVGLVLRLAIRPQRVWLEETADGCRVWGNTAEG
ncbi:MAG TPA: hypothetical protein VIH45_07765 [Desulfuromonadaceae bacterium]